MRYCPDRVVEDNRRIVDESDDCTARSKQRPEEVNKAEASAVTLTLR